MEGSVHLFISSTGGEGGGCGERVYVQCTGCLFEYGLAANAEALAVYG
jgi:hypothetical protein